MSNDKHDASFDVKMDELGATMWSAVLWLASFWKQHSMLYLMDLYCQVCMLDMQRF